MEIGDEWEDPERLEGLIKKLQSFPEFGSSLAVLKDKNVLAIVGVGLSFTFIVV